jgi:hypothetical protein
VAGSSLTPTSGTKTRAYAGPRRRGTGHRVPADQHVVELQPAAGAARRRTDQVALGEPDARHQRPGGELGAHRRRAAAQRGAAVVADHHRQQARPALLHHVAGLDQAAGDLRHRGAHAGMPRERQLLTRREDAQPVGGRIGGGRQHEHRLGEVELLRQRLELRGLQAVGVEHHGKLVAGERTVGEDVDDVEPHARHGNHRRF